MNLKKIFVAAVLCGTLAAGAFAADNYTLGIDIAGGIVGFGSTKFKGNVGVEDDFSYKEVPFLPLKVNTYCCPWLGNHLGIYGSIGLLPEAMVNFRGERTGKDDDPWTGVGLEFMVGPAVGVDLGDSGIRFQCGVPFHAEFGFYFWEGSDVKKTRSYSAFGLGLTPQFRFMANRRCSLVLGADFVFDFGMSFKQENEGIGRRSGTTTTVKLGPKNAFRFRALPYIGLGINFGK